MADDGEATDMDVDLPPTPSLTFPRLICGGFYIPKPNPFKPQGEDAYFFFTDLNAIGVADGVGGCSRRGVDAGEYARMLMAQCVAAIVRRPADPINPRIVLSEAFHETSGIPGSSTACVITLRNDFLLHGVSIGDSGLMIFRNNRMVYRSPVQQYSFNHPYQLGGRGSSDNPSSAMELEVPVMVNDVIVVATDGLFDNVFPGEIEDLLRSFSDNNVCLIVGPKVLACSISNLAHKNSTDRMRITPFSEAATTAGLNHCGGKIDDITVVVGYAHPI